MFSWIAPEELELFDDLAAGCIADPAPSLPGPAFDDEPLAAGLNGCIALAYVQRELSNATADHHASEPAV
jgi:hypothetical protein